MAITVKEDFRALYAKKAKYIKLELCESLRVLTGKKWTLGPDIFNTQYFFEKTGWISETPRIKTALYPSAHNALHVELLSENNREHIERVLKHLSEKYEMDIDVTVMKQTTLFGGEI